MSAYVASIAVAVVVAALYESEALVGGNFATDKGAEFLLTSFMELLTLASIPLALRLFKFSAVKKALAARKAEALKRWGLLRVLLLGVPMVANTVLYYLFMSTTFGYMAIILLLCMPFVFPSIGKCNYEVSIVDKSDET